MSRKMYTKENSYGKENVMSTNANINSKKKINKKRKRKNQDLVSLFIFFAVIALVVVGMMWIDKVQSMPDDYKGNGTSIEKEEVTSDDRILIVATVTSAGIFAALVIKKAINNARKKKIEKEKREKLKQLLEAQRQKQNRDSNIDQILAAGRSTINSRAYHKNFYNNRQNNNVIDIKEERMRDIEENEKINGVLDEYMYKDYKKKNLMFYMSLGCVVVISSVVIAAILLF